MNTTIDIPTEIPVKTTKTGMDPSKKAELIEKAKRATMGYNPCSYVQRFPLEDEVDAFGEGAGGCALCILSDNALVDRPSGMDILWYAADKLGVSPHHANLIEGCTMKNPGAQYRHEMNNYVLTWPEVIRNMEERL